jgi:integrase
MKKPQKEDYGWNEETGWTLGGKAKFKSDIKTWEIARPKGKVRIHPIHESWVEILKYFDSSNPQRSQGAFCRWANIKPASFSSKKVKPLGDDLERFILEWVAKFKEVENG